MLIGSVLISSHDDPYGAAQWLPAVPWPGQALTHLSVPGPASLSLADSSVSFQLWAWGQLCRMPSLLHSLSYCSILIAQQCLSSLMILLLIGVLVDSLAPLLECNLQGNGCFVYCVPSGIPNRMPLACGIRLSLYHLLDEQKEENPLDVVYCKIARVAAKCPSLHPHPFSMPFCNISPLRMTFPLLESGLAWDWCWPMEIRRNASVFIAFFHEERPGANLWEVEWLHGRELYNL